MTCQPAECAFCRQTKDEVEGFQICHRIDREGNRHTGALCNGCIRMFVVEMAHRDPAGFEKFVDEARMQEPESSNPENSN